MSEEKALAKGSGGGALSTNIMDYAVAADQIVKQTTLVQEIMMKVMKGPDKDDPHGTHFGLIPGCGNKPVLKQPGAQKLAATFQLHCEVVERTQTDLPNGHREVRFRVVVKMNANGMVIGEGVATCTTMEKKYRYRRGSDVELTDQQVPKAFWDLDREKQRSPEGRKLLGGNDRVVKKTPEGKWVIGIKNKEAAVEHDNPADYWNTIEKIGYKRAQMHAIINATACSDIFEQDLEYLQSLLDDDNIIDVSAAPYADSNTTTTRETQSEMKMEDSPEPPKDLPPVEEPKAKKKSETKPPPEETKSEPKPEPKPESGKMKLLGPTGNPVPASPPKPEAGHNASTEYAKFILNVFQSQIEQSITMKMLSSVVACTPEEGWSQKVINDLMKLYADTSADPATTVPKYFSKYY